MEKYENGRKVNRRKKKCIFAFMIFGSISIGVIVFIVYNKNNNINKPRITECIKKSKSNTATVGKEEQKSSTTSTSILASAIKPYLDKQGWSFLQYKRIKEEEIPLTFEVKNDELPFGIIWAYNNELSKLGGLDFSPYRGKKVKIYAMDIQHKITQDIISSCNIIIFDGKIIGAWLGNESGAGYAGFMQDGMYGGVEISIEKVASSLYKSSYSENISRKLKNSDQQEILKNYFEAINKKDYRLAYYLLDLQRQIEKCSLGEKNITDKIFSEEKIELLEMEKNLNGPNSKWTDDLGQEVQIESFFIKVNSLLKDKQGELYRIGDVEFIKRGNDPWKISYVGWRISNNISTK